MAAGKTITSKYPGTCRGCDDDIRIGAKIEFFGSGEAYHYDCRPVGDEKPNWKSFEQEGFLFKDLETGGLEFEKCGIVQVAVIATTNRFVVIDSFSTLIAPNPRMRYDDAAMKIHGKSLKDLEGQPPEVGALQMTHDFCRQFEGFRYAGYNCPFDLGFWAAACKRNGIVDKVWTLPPFDLLEVAREVVKGTANFRLTTVAEAYDIPISGAHHALIDDFLTVQVARKILPVGEGEIEYA